MLLVEVCKVRRALILNAVLLLHPFHAVEDGVFENLGILLICALEEGLHHDVTENRDFGHPLLELIPLSSALDN